MNPLFGVGLKRFLFEMNDLSVQARISGIIGEQVATYMPFVAVDDVIYSDENSHVVNIELHYSVDGFEESEILNIPLS